MSGRITRRNLLKKGALAAAAFAGTRLSQGPFLLGADTAQDKLRLAVIGCGGQGTGAHVPPATRQKLVALVDPDPKCIAGAMKKAQSTEPTLDPSSVQVFDDYRKLFDTMAKDIDGVIIATPNHHHALPALIAMQLGKGTYVEKPMAYNIAEARRMAEFAEKYKVGTQMGNQGHSEEGWRRLCEYIWAGAIGQVHTVYTWTDRANGGYGGRPPAEPVPAGMNWETWIGPAPYRDYHKDLHPHEWHGWHDFGDGSLGNMACHIIDGAHWSLKLGAPTSIEVEDMIGGELINGRPERYPVSTRIRWDFPAREGMGPVKLYWYDGIKRGTVDPGRGDIIGSVGKAARNRPALVEELEKKYNRNFGNDASLYVGDKGMMVAGNSGTGVRIIPEEAHQAFPVPEKILPRLAPGIGHHGSWFNAIRTGQLATSNFQTAAKLTELILLGTLAMKAGPGKKLLWDGNQCTNMSEINQYLARESRKGWTI